LLLPVETRVLTGAVPSTLRPRSHWLPEIEEPNVEVGFAVSIPIENAQVFDVRVLFLVQEVCSLLFGRIGFPDRLKSCFCSSVALENNVIWIVNVSMVGNDAWFVCEAEQSGRLNSIVMKHVKVAPKCRKKLQDADLQVGVVDYLRTDESVSLCVSWVFFHDVKFRIFVGKSNGRDHVSAQVDAQN
jgi:hypothetical protein